ncbi:MAG: nucleotidyltransferase domain-containing protein [Nanoarchaeota archaeon]
METYKLKFTRLQNEILRLLCIKVGSSINQSEIARALKVSSTAIAKSLPLLKKEKLIIYSLSPRMNLTFIELNRDNPQAISLKRIENLKLIYESGIITILEEIFPGATIILFGSYSKGEDTTESDIDIAIVAVKEKEVNLERLSKRLEREISLNFYDSLKKIDKHLRNNILNGIVLTGSVDV